MDNLTIKSIEEHIERIIEDFSFEKRSKEHPDECCCYKTKPCHDTENLNCFLCYCPKYDTSKPEGGCKIGNPQSKGFYFSRPGHPISEKIWDCTFCDYPNMEEVVREFLWALFTGQSFNEKLL